MKVLLINGSPHKQGNTFLALSEAAKTLEQQGIETEIVHIGVKPVRGCIACAQCKIKQLDRCVSHRRFARVLWSAQRLRAIAYPAHVLLGRCQGGQQARCSSLRMSSWWCHSSLSDHEYAVRDDEHACGYFAILEHRVWPRGRSGSARH